MYLFLLGILTLAFRVEAFTIDTFQAKLVVLNAPRHGQQLVGNVSYHVRKLTPTGEWLLYTLVFGPVAAKPGSDLKTGDTVLLTVDLDLSGFVAGSAYPGAAFAGEPGTLYVWSWVGGDTSGGLSTGYSPTPSRPRLVVWAVTSVCGEEVVGGVTAEDVTRVLFGPPAGAALQTPGDPAQPPFPTALPLKRVLYECSYGAVTLKRSNTLVLNLSLPCSGVRANGAAWNATRGSPGIAGACGTNELWGWIEYAVQYTEQVLGPTVFVSSLGLRRLLVLPPAGPGALCPDWQQRGTFGCDDSLGCDVWVQGDPDRLLPWTLTQLGSSLLLRPASRLRGTNPAGPVPLATGAQPTDPSCPMGSPEGDFKCFSAPNTYTLNLAQPLLKLDASSGFTAGSTRVVQLPAAALSPANMLLVVPNWLPAPSAAPRPLFGQFRAPVAGDSGLPAAVAGKLVLHSINASAPVVGLGAAPETVLLAALSAGESYRFDLAKIVVSFQSWSPPPPEDAGGVTGGSATVAVCRYLATTETGGNCYDGVDNDCDGLVDDDDPDCQPVWG